MASTTDQFTQKFLTYKDVKDSNPDWTEDMVEDYLSLKRDLVTTADAGDSTSEVAASANAPLLSAELALLKKQVGSGQALTSDETGFTVDSIDLTVDRIEA